MSTSYHPSRGPGAPAHREGTQMKRESLESITLFGTELLSNGGSVGAAVPSSRALARRMASYLPTESDGYVIELGAGTGVVTAALLEHGVPADRVIPVELSAKMACHLQKRFPGVHVVQGDATRLDHLLSESAPQAHRRISHIVSSLPLRSLPADAVKRIAHEIHRLLPPDGQFVQFTYQLICRQYQPLAAFERCATSFVWFNFPPARVDVYRVRARA